MEYDLLHLSALPRHADLFERRGPDGRRPTRAVWLRDLFSNPLPFTHRGGRFHFAPVAGVDRSISVGRIGRLTTATEAAPPEENLEQIERPAWIASVVLIDPRHHDEGQRVAMEHKGSIGRPLAIFQSLADQVNSSDPPEPYVLEVSNIAEEATFWTFVDQHQGAITSASFELIAPNMFGQDSDFDKEMAALKKNEKIQKVKFDLESEEGLNLKTPRVESTARYAARGGGIIKARTRDGKRFNSASKGKKVHVPAPTRGKKDQKGESVLDWIKKSIGTIFK